MKDKEIPISRGLDDEMTSLQDLMKMRISVVRQTDNFVIAAASSLGRASIPSLRTSHCFELKQLAGWLAKHH